MRVGEIRRPERGSQRPLDGVRILAAEQMQALPYATRLLAGLGADVVKVEPPKTGESGRGGQPALVDRDGRTVGATYLRNNLSKRSIALDLKTERGKRLFIDLIPHFDVVCENFTPGVMKRLGLDYETLAKDHPGLVYCSVSGFGHLAESPYRRWPAYAPMVEAMAGLYEPTKKPGQPLPVVVAGALGDNAAALIGVIGILAALHHKQRTGEGQYVDVSMYDAMLAMADMIPNLHSMGAPPGWATAGSIGIVAGFEARDGRFVVAVLRPHHFERMARLIGHPEWIGDPRFATLTDWAARIEDTVRPAIEAWAADKTRLEACEAFCAEGVAAGPSQVAEDIVADPHVEAHDMLIEAPRADGGPPVRIVGNPIKMSKLQEGPFASWPTLGEHTDAVLGELLDLDADELARLRADGVIGG